MGDRMDKGTKWSCFVLHEDGTWEQPTYGLTRSTNEADFCRAVLLDHGRKCFMVVGVGEDPDCDDEDARELPVLEEDSNG